MGQKWWVREAKLCELDPFCWTNNNLEVRIRVVILEENNKDLMQVQNQLAMVAFIARISMKRPALFSKTKYSNNGNKTTSQIR